ncbi:cryptochrome/photolyase family protein [Flavicella sediminum]|uniref:cryptochrome/photolyase family protein n=1 Tax=Flavicella sediminum TaxID=2585141 RepID=UPI0011218A92|nr:deoxyribodipyrimidine photo-lyase [Flavicella sediminum]
MNCTFFWFRRDLRLHDNKALFKALNSGKPVIPLFIFDTNITNRLPKNDARIGFIHQQLAELDAQLKKAGSSLLIKKGNPIEIWETLTQEHKIEAVYCNKDYEPTAIERDFNVKKLLKEQNISFYQEKDQVIFEESEVVKDDSKPYTVYTPYKNKWLKKLAVTNIEKFPSEELTANFCKTTSTFPSLEKLNFEKSSIQVKAPNFNFLNDYDSIRDFPFIDKTSYLSPHLRFGTFSIREILQKAQATNAVFLSELIWREFFMQILFHFPRVANENFKVKYNRIEWRNNEEEFKNWCNGTTGYPMVDAGMRQLNKTGYMHNRVRMITAGFLCKHLLIDWRWGEAYFAEKLLDYELSSNNGNWQWAAGTGCDSAPYFRVFNPSEQLKKFDKDLQYIKKWITDFDELSYPQPIVDHKTARLRAIERYKTGLQ